MKKYLIDFFTFNDKANRKVLESIKILPDNKECIKLFSHLINCMYKWFAGIKNDPLAAKLEWWNPVYPLSRLEGEWQNCIQLWMEYLEGKSEAEINSEIILNNFEGGNWAIKPADIALQLNYHSIHHRGQMQYIISKQGLKPNYIEYIGGKYRKIE